MKRIIAVAAVALACNGYVLGPSNLNAEGKYTHPINLSSLVCVSGKYSLQASWALYEATSNDWTATFKKGSQVVSTVRDYKSTKVSECVYLLGDRATVVITPNGALAVDQAVDSASTTIR